MLKSFVTYGWPVFIKRKPRRYRVPSRIEATLPALPAGSLPPGTVRRLLPMRGSAGALNAAKR